MGVVGSGLAAADFLADEASASKTNTLKITSLLWLLLGHAAESLDALRANPGFAEAGESFVIPYRAHNWYEIDRFGSLNVGFPCCQ
jgi:hypothetical protein